MIIKRSAFDIKAMAQELMRHCPQGAGADFKFGYASFVIGFFQDLDFCTDAFRDTYDELDAELDVLIQVTLNKQEKIAQKIPAIQQVGYISGYQSAANEAASLMKFAFELEATNLAA